MPKSQAIKRHGGKAYQAQHICRLMHPHLHFVDVYFGGGSVTFAHDCDHDWMLGHPDVHWPGFSDATLASGQKGVSEVVNDLDDALMNFWRVMSSKKLFAAFQEHVERCPAFSESLWKSCTEYLSSSLTRLPPAPAWSPESGDGSVCVEHAFAFFVNCRQSRAALGKDFATMVKTRTRGRVQDQVNAWMSAVEGLPEVHERLKRIASFDCRPALDVIRSQDGPLTLFYLDPPYLHDTRATKVEYGAREMTFVDHCCLLALLGSYPFSFDQRRFVAEGGDLNLFNELSATFLDGKFVLSGYPSDLYDSWAMTNAMSWVDLEIDNKSSGKKSKDKKIERCWMNYKLPEGS